MTSEERLKELSAQVPSLGDEDVRAMASERARRALRRAAAGGVVVIVLAVVGVQWFRPVPTPVYRSALSSDIHLPGRLPSLPWPRSGDGELAVDGGPVLGRTGAGAPVPVAGLAKVMAAYVALRDHPLPPGSDGPQLTVGADAVASYRAEAGHGQSVVPVTQGETLTERQALQGLLVASGNDMADLLADWDAGSAAAFVARMNDAARALGMTATTFRDDAGLDPGTVASPADLVRLGEAALAVPAIRDTVAMTEAAIPLAGRVYNLDADVGHDGIVGIKTGSDAAAGGCFLFAATRAVAGGTATLVGVLLGERTAMPEASVLAAARSLVRAAFAEATTVPVLRPGQVVGRIVAPWAGAGPVPVTSAGGVTVTGWPGTTVPVRAVLRRLGRSLPAHQVVVRLAVGAAGERHQVTGRTAAALAPPSPWWHLSRI